MEKSGGRDLIVVGTSAGGLDVLTRLLAQLPADLPAAVCIVQHLPPQSPGTFAGILDRECALPVRQAEDEAALAHGHVYVAPPGRHLIVAKGGQMRLWYGPRENRARPAIDPLFRSAAGAYGMRVVGVVLSGALDDGTMGLRTIKAAGGVAVVQAPADAPYPSMPQSALDYVPGVDHVLPVAEMGAVLERLTRAPGGSGDAPPETEATPSSPDEPMRPSHEHARDDDESHERAPAESASGQRPLEAPAHSVYAAEGDLRGEEGRFVGLACPECGGPLEELFPKGPRSYRCHEGHRYTAQSLLAGQNETAERALWSALRVLEERHRMLRRMTADARERDRSQMAERYAERTEEAERHAENLRALLQRFGGEQHSGNGRASREEGGGEGV